MSRVDLGDGQWCELRDPKRVSERRRRAYISAMSEFNASKAGITDPALFGARQQDLLDTALDLLIVCLVSSWSFEQPVTVEVLADLGTDVFDPLKRACLALASEVLPDYAPSPDPTQSSNGSTGSPTDSEKATSTSATL